MSDQDPKLPDEWTPSFRHHLLDVDARVDSFMFQAARLVREGYERFSAFMDNFHVAGWRRGFVELMSEGATLGTGGLVLMLALAMPAFQETSDDDWLKKSELAMTVLDRYGNEVGARGIKHNDSVPLEQFPDHLIKAVLATEDRRFYEHFCTAYPTNSTKRKRCAAMVSTGVHISTSRYGPPNSWNAGLTSCDL